MTKVIELYYDKLSGVYDKESVKGKWEPPNEINKTLLQYRLVKSKLAILDLGTGTGQSVKSFIGKDCEIYVVDISHKMLQMAKQKYPTVKTFKYDLSSGLEGLGFRRKSFDLIIASGTLEFVNHIKRFVYGASKLLRPEGYFIFTYEVLLRNHNLQKSKVQYNASGYIKNPPNNTRFKLYRIEKEVVTKTLNKAKFEIIRHYKFRAFLKGPEKFPVFYNLVLAKNK